MRSILPEASKTVLTPMDASQLHSYGLVIAQEKIYSTRDEKRELFDRILQLGEDVTIEYRINGIRAEVVYRVSCLEPSHAYVGRGTTVIIEGESPNVKREVALKHRRLSSLFTFDIGMGTGLPVTSHEEHHFNIQPYKKSSNSGVNSRSQERGHTFEVRRYFRAMIQEKLSWLKEQMKLCESYGLNANNLISEVDRLTEELRYYW